MTDLSINSQKLRGIASRLIFAAFTALAALALPAQAQTTTRQISLPNQDYTESTQDLSVKVLGGQVTITRTYSWGKWYLNDAWADLVLQPDPMGGVLYVQRIDRVYARITNSDPTQALYSFDENNYIRTLSQSGQITGWQWYDRLGNTINYDQNGHIQSYANAAGVKVSFVYNAQNQMTGVQDHQGRQVISIDYSNGLPIKISDTSGRSVAYEWNLPAATNGISLAQLTKVTDVRGNTWSYTYTSAGYIQSRTDPAGGQIQLTYLTQPARQTNNRGGAIGTGAPDASQSAIGSTKISIPPAIRVGSITDEVGATTNYRIDYNRVKQQYLVSIQQPSGATQSQLYDNKGTLLQNSIEGMDLMTLSKDSDRQERTTDARGLTTIVQYDSASARRPIKTIYPDGSWEATEYDPIYNRKTKYTDPLGTVSTWSYDSKGNVTSYVEAQGKPEQRTTLYTYDSYGQMLSRSRGAGDGKGADAQTWRFEYDDKGNQIKITDPMGNSSTATFNSQGLPLTQTNALGNTSSATYDATGKLLTVTNPLNQTVKYAYDGMGRKVQTISAAGRIQTIIYDKAGRVTETRQPGESQGTRTEYDAAGRPIKTISSGGLVTQSSYDGQDRITQTIDPAGNNVSSEYGASGSALAGLLTAVTYPTYKETYQYDQRNRRTVITQQLGDGKTLIQRQGLDANGQLISNTDPAGRTALYFYDALGRLVKTIDAMNQSTLQTWDAQDNLVTLTDAKGNQHKFGYDQTNRRIKETRPMGGSIQYSYDAAGNLTRRTDAGGNTRTYSYDIAGNISTEEHKLNGSTLDQQISYSYDQDGWLIGYEQKDGSDELISSANYSLDGQGRTAQSNITYGKIDGGSFSFTIGQSFNADGQLASHTYPDGSLQSYSYSNGRLSKVTLPDGSEISYGNYSWNEPSQISTPGATKSVSYDALQRPISIEVKNQSAQILASRLYQYDDAGNITQIESDLGKTTYSYDQLDRLTQAQPDDALQVKNLPLEQYYYDAVGNRTASGHQPGTWSYNQDNQLTQYPKLEPFSPGASPIDTQVSYTPQGHTSKETNSQGERSYSYNAAERLISYASTPQGQFSPSLETNYRYDPLGRRISKSVTENGRTTITYFIYNDSGLIGEVNEQGKLNTAYGFSPQATQLEAQWSTDPIWQSNVSNGSLLNTATNFHYLYTDSLYTPMLATEKSGTTSWKAISEAFGETSVMQESNIVMNLRFPGQYFDQETDMHHNFYRDYKPNIGRYLQVDPAGLDGGVNDYIYVAGYPLGAIDPEGLFAITTVDAYCKRRPKDCILPVPITKPLVSPVPLPKEEKKCPKCSDYPYNRYVPCDRLTIYAHNSFNSAYIELKMLNGGVNIVRGPNTPAAEGPCGLNTPYATGQHISFKYKGARAGSLVSCECCTNKTDGVEIKEKWAVIP